MSDKKYLFWDFDGTLGYRESLWTVTLFDVLRKNDIEHLDFSMIRPLMNIGYPWHGYLAPHKSFMAGNGWWRFIENHITRVLRLQGIPQQQSRSLAEQFKEEFLRPSAWKLFDDTKTSLLQLTDAGYTHIMVSNHVPELHQLVKLLGLDTFIEQVFTSAEVGFEKPDFRIFQHVFETLQIGPLPEEFRFKSKPLPPHYPVMIGDNYTADIAGALNFGLPGLLVRGENPKEYPWFSEDLKNIQIILSNLKSLTQFK